MREGWNFGRGEGVEERVGMEVVFIKRNWGGEKRWWFLELLLKMKVFSRWLLLSAMQESGRVSTSTTH